MDASGEVRLNQHWTDAGQIMENISPDRVTLLVPF
jgi:hypothetical protein